ncbi:uncharacterized protein LOC128987423 isoform X2 [Macrosteles quadrilineatus]|uniref:uncharacterized protein LOC128987423 isoform X2 n=1 Tax=Macrosteles quadrilineatus TaxID=74068 RepID=UPI0023E33FA8|nr:uncharacterized protein LOC128987423 isoform X2 [Macrosteles quadrilineatus]
MASDSDDEFVDSVLNVLKKESSSTLIRVEPTRAARPSIYIDKEENEAQIENDKTGSKPTRELNQAVMLVECSAEVIQLSLTYMYLSTNLRGKSCTK